MTAGGNIERKKSYSRWGVHGRGPPSARVNASTVVVSTTPPTQGELRVRRDQHVVLKEGEGDILRVERVRPAQLVGKGLGDALEEPAWHPCQIRIL